MYCIKCGQQLETAVNFCGKCGWPVSKNTEPATTGPVSKTESHVALKTEDERIKVKYDNKAASVFNKIFIAVIIASLIGLIAYPISNSILEVDKKDLSLSDYSFQQKYGADNAALRKEVLTDQSLDNAKIAAIISFVIILTAIFVRVENKKKNTEVMPPKTK